jgi:hypothetical protein
MMTEQNMTWKELLVSRPDLVHFIQYIAQKHGGMPDGPIDVDDLQRFMKEYMEDTA